MDNIKNYLISVIAAALICSIATAIAGKKGTVGAVIKLLTGLFLIITVISPLHRKNVFTLPKNFSDFSLQASDIAAEGQNIAQNEMASIIKQQVESYILDKASILNMKVEVQVTMSATSPMKPESVTVMGNIAPYGKQRLEQIICNDLGIAKENQFWS